MYMYTCLAVGSTTMSAEGEVCIRCFAPAVAIFFLVAVGGAFIGLQRIWPEVNFDGEGPALFSEQLDCR